MVPMELAAGGANGTDCTTSYRFYSLSQNINMTDVYIYLSTPPSTGAASCHQSTEEYMYTTVLPRGFVGGWLIGQAPNFIIYTLLGLVKLLRSDPEWVE